MHAKACTKPLKTPAVPGLASAIFTPVQLCINTKNYLMEVSDPTLLSKILWSLNKE